MNSYPLTPIEQMPAKAPASTLRFYVDCSSKAYLYGHEKFESATHFIDVLVPDRDEAMGWQKIVDAANKHSPSACHGIDHRLAAEAVSEYLRQTSSTA